MLTDFTNWLAATLATLFTVAWQFIQDGFIAVFRLVVMAFVTLVSAVPVPSFMSQGLGSTWSGMDGGILYIVTACGVPAALAIIGSGYAFRLARKFLTLFQW
jgi:hypothetical protein